MFALCLVIPRWYSLVSCVQGFCFTCMMNWWRTHIIAPTSCLKIQCKWRDNNTQIVVLQVSHRFSENVCQSHGAESRTATERKLGDVFPQETNLPLCSGEQFTMLRSLFSSAPLSRLTSSCTQLASRLILNIRLNVTIRLILRRFFWIINHCRLYSVTMEGWGTLGMERVSVSLIIWRVS